MKSAELEEKGSDIWQLFREAQQSKLLLMYFVCPSLLRPVLTHFLFFTEWLPYRYLVLEQTTHHDHGRA